MALAAVDLAAVTLTAVALTAVALTLTEVCSGSGCSDSGFSGSGVSSVRRAQRMQSESFAIKGSRDLVLDASIPDPPLPTSPDSIILNV